MENTYVSRHRKIQTFEARLLQTQGSNIVKSYYLRHIFYGPYIEVTDYNKIQFIRKPERLSYTKNLSGTKKDFSLQRARAQVFRIVEANAYQHGKFKPIFFTLTTKDQLKEYKESNKKLKAFARRFLYKYGYPLKYIIIPELHKTGAIHYHGVMFNAPYIPVRVFTREIWKFGFTDLKLPKKINSVSRYLTKYLTKDFTMATPLHTKMYFCSRGLLRPYADYTDVPLGGKMQLQEVIPLPDKIKIIYKRCKH